MSKLSVGFGIIFMIFATYACYNYESIVRIRAASRLLDQITTYQETLLKAEIAHHLWVEAVASYIIDDTVTEVNVTDKPRECSFGKWYYGQERKIMVDGAAGQIRSIATASEEQAASSREITTSVSEINTVATQTAQSMLHASKAVDDLAEQIGRLNTLIMNLRKG